CTSRARRRPFAYLRCAAVLASALARPRAEVCYNQRGGEASPPLTMDTRAFYNEREENKAQKILCPSCRNEFTASVGWKVCTKKRELPRGANSEDRAKFVKATSYMVRLDDLVACHKCRKRIELTGQSTVLINDSLGDRNLDPENFGNR